MPPWPVAELDQPALAGEHLGRQLTRVLAGHRPLDTLDDGRDRRAVVGELPGAVVHGDAGALADVLVVGALVGVLEAAPAADVIDQHHLEVGAAALDVGDRPLQLVEALQPVLPSSAELRTISRPCRSAYSRIVSAWFSVEYC